MVGDKSGILPSCRPFTNVHAIEEPPDRAPKDERSSPKIMFQILVKSFNRVLLYLYAEQFPS